MGCWSLRAFEGRSFTLHRFFMVIIFILSARAGYYHLVFLLFVQLEYFFVEAAENFFLIVIFRHVFLRCLIRIRAAAWTILNPHRAQNISKFLVHIAMLPLIIWHNKNTFRHFFEQFFNFINCWFRLKILLFIDKL